MNSRGARDLPLTYHGTYDSTITYLPRQVVRSGGSVYMAVATSTGADPASSPASWVPMGGRGGWTPEVFIGGFGQVASNLYPPGLRVPFDCTVSTAYFRASTAPSGAPWTFVVSRSGSTLITLSIAAGGTSTSGTGLSVALSMGDILNFGCTSIGSGVAGADAAIQLIAE